MAEYVYVYGKGVCTHVAESDSARTVCGHDALDLFREGKRPGSWPLCERCRQFVERERVTIEAEEGQA